MRQPVYFSGPWKGVDGDAQDPRVSFSDVLDVEFPGGVARQREFMRVVGGPVVLPNGSPLVDLLAVVYAKHRDGMDRFVYVTRRKLYIGDGSGLKLVDATGSANWLAESPSDITHAHVVTDNVEWMVLATRMRPYLFRLASGTQRFEELKVPTSPESSSIRGGRVITTFGDRLVFGGVMFGLGEVPHAVGWFGVKGPFDWTLPTSGYMALTDVPGPVTALAHVQDFLAVFKEQGVYLLQKTFVPELPFAAFPRLHALGVSKPGHVVSVLQQSALVFYSEVTRRVYLWDLERVTDISRPVMRELDARSDPMLTYNEHASTVDVAYEDVVLRYSVTEGWWAKETSWWPYYPVPRFVKRMGITIDELEGTIDDQQGRIDDYRAAEVLSKRCYATVGGFIREDREAMGSSVWRTAPLRFPKPTTITSFEVYLKAPTNVVVSLRYSIDEGASWTQYVVLSSGDIEHGAYTHHFVETSRSFIFEIAVEGKGVELVHWGVDVVGSKLQEDEVPHGAVVSVT